MHSSLHRAREFGIVGGTVGFRQQFDQNLTTVRSESDHFAVANGCVAGARNSAKLYVRPNRGRIPVRSWPLAPQPLAPAIRPDFNCDPAKVTAVAIPTIQGLDYSALVSTMCRRQPIARAHKTVKFRPWSVRTSNLIESRSNSFRIAVEIWPNDYNTEQLTCEFQYCTMRTERRPRVPNLF